MISKVAVDHLRQPAPLDGDRLMQAPPQRVLDPPQGRPLVCRTGAGRQPPSWPGLRTSGVVAPFVVDGAIDRAAFNADVETGPRAGAAPGDIVVIDNLSSHKSHPVRGRSRRPAPSCCSSRPTVPTSIQSRTCIAGTSERGLLLTPRVGHRGLVLLARWLARRHDAEAATPAVDGPTNRSTPTSGGADQHAYPAAPVRRSGGLP